MVFGHRFIPFIRFPQVFPVITSILLVQTVVFIMLISTGHAHEQAYWVRYGAYIDWRIDEGEWWRYFSAIFLHVSFWQYFFISFALYIFGPQLEWLLGRFFFLFYYLVTGSITYISYHLLEIPGIHTGASGAIYGILGFYVYLYLRKLMDPKTGKGLLVLIAINLLFDLDTAFIHLLALACGCLLTSIMIEIRRLKIEEQEDDEN